MITIWKQPLEVLSAQVIRLPEGFEVLHFAMQHGDSTFWYRCDSEAKTNPVTIRMCGTGHSAPSEKEATYLGTVQVGSLVWHYFMEREE